MTNTKVVPAASGLDADDVRAASQNAIEVFADEENAEQCREVAEYMREVLLADLERAAQHQPPDLRQLAAEFDAAPDGLRVQVCKLGRYGAAFDPASTHYAYTYTEQPDNVGAMKLGRAAAINGTRRHGDEIDRGLHLLLQLQAEGFGVFQIATAPSAPATVQGVNQQLLEALENTATWIEQLPVPTVGAAGQLVKIDKAIAAARQEVK